MNIKNSTKELARLMMANQIIKDYIKENYKETSWRYIDFVKNARFYDEIKSDKDIDPNFSPEELAEYCLEKICEGNLIEISVNSMRI